jgi:16S rRNA (guanine527-N7)-methyltransferase
VVSARALAALDQLLAWTEPLLTTGTTGLFPKGRDVAAELTQARKSWTFEADILPSRTDSEARILRITSLASAAR